MLMETPAERAAYDFIKGMADGVSMPDIYQKVRELINNQGSDIADFADLIKNDPSLSIKLSRIASSEYFGFPRRAEGLYQAISLIGIMQLHDLILNSLSLRTFASIPQQVFNLEAFWTYSIQCGIAARTIAQHSQIFPINPFFTYGLLHEIGHAAMFARAPGRSLQVLEAGDMTIQQQLEKELQIFGFTYTEAGSALIRQWRLPSVYQQIAAYHLSIDQADRKHQRAVRVVHLAHQFCQFEQSIDTAGLLEIHRNADPQLLKLPDNISDIVKREIELNSENILQMLWPSGVQRSFHPGAS